MPKCTRLSRGVCLQRGRASRSAPARCARRFSPSVITAFVSPAWWPESVRKARLRHAQVLGRYIASASQVPVSALWRGHGVGSLAHRAGSAVACGSAWQTVVFVAPVAHSRYGHPLRFYIRPHFRKCGAVVALKLHLVPHTAARPDGFPKQALCKVAFAGDGRTAVGAPRSRVHALRAAVCTPLWCACTWALVRRCALRFGQWPTASHVVSAPPTLGLAAARHWPARSARPPPRGSLRTARKLGGAALTRLNFKSHPLSRRVKYTTTETFLKMTVLLTVLFRIKH